MDNFTKNCIISLSIYGGLKSVIDYVMCLFIKEFITNPFSTGAVASSSAELADLITSTANLPSRKTIVEIGSGMGVFTKRILQNIDKSSDFFVVEINPKFALETKRLCPEINVFTDSASNIIKYLENLGMNGCDCIISGLPWTAFNNDSQEEILDSVYKSLLPGGIFLTFVYIQSQFLPSGIRFRKKLTDKFGNIYKTHTVWKNIPPAFIYYSIKAESI